jgi:hypothetical protein
VVELDRRTDVRYRAPLLVAGLLATTLACPSSDPTAPPAPRVFQFSIRGLPDAEGRFVAVTSDPAVLARLAAELALPAADRRLHVHGAVAPGDGGHNAPWNWHFVPGSWDVVEASIELCDGTPAMVDPDPDGWMDKAGAFCPWGSYVEAEL